MAARPSGAALWETPGRLSLPRCIQSRFKSICRSWPQKAPLSVARSSTLAARTAAW